MAAATREPERELAFSQRARINGPAFLIGWVVALAQLEVATGDAAGSLIVFAIIGSLTIAGAVVYFLLGGPAAKAGLDDMKSHP